MQMPVFPLPPCPSEFPIGPMAVPPVMRSSPTSLFARPRKRMESPASLAGSATISFHSQPSISMP